ncbi:HypC/HybG/HupF family hydrogenase formation chaperone [Epibacterium sp. SM1979]|uniref:HypC/HybG/HupF family hydrogenase formation chaperone n=1 Tax=Tritonibacter litoralis TaxID=2662264 RepID=A0A843YBL1_9RHOB|nr:HypC/HybG/HupF family hydrogenase formation chaperone [Tritonibacter litoralis]MQQ07268.1 HypC/HybG/HupF family hydrogenase formation chaperone [Tritonibacter litoralis]
MCVGIPMQILSVEGIAAQARESAHRPVEIIDLSLTGPLEPGAWVLSFLGAAREVISAEEAGNISNALDGLRSLMEGGDLGNAFADLEARTPSLPPHLQAAAAQGKTVG